MTDIYPPTHLQVPTPHVVPHGRGLASTNSFGTTLKMRISNADRKLIKDEVDALRTTEGNEAMSESMFARWATVYVARALRKARTNEAIDVDT